MVAVDLLVFGPHPDDLEIGLGGTIARHTAAGDAVGLCDLTAGELSTNGTPDIRLREAEEAARALGAAWRENLGWPDGGITGSPEQLRSAVDLIRLHRPRAIAIPYWQDRHPDHPAASEALSRAIFMSGLRRYETGAEPWRPEWTCYYFINDGATPSFVVDVSAHYAIKQRALDCYQSQFTAGGGHRTTRLTGAPFRHLIATRDGQFGALAGVEYAEGVVVREPIVGPGLFKARA